MHSLPITTFSTSSCDGGESFAFLCNTIGVGVNNGFKYGFSHKTIRAGLNSMFTSTLEGVKLSIQNAKQVPYLGTALPKILQPYRIRAQL